MNIVIIDYGLGNLASVYNALLFVGAKPKISASAAEIEKADKLILPGVGACGDAMKGLEERGLTGPVTNSLAKGKPYLGICLGLQILFEKSEEGKTKGLGIFKGSVKRFRERDGIKVPQIGWNKVKFSRKCFTLRDPAEVHLENLHAGQITNYKLQITNGIENNSYFYFDHSYYAEPADKGIVAGTTDYGITFASMVRKDNICAVQFHPERSQELGLKMLENFVRL